MPIMDGMVASTKIFQFLKSQLDQEKQLPTTIFAVTAYTDVGRKNECKRIGIKEVYNKPLKFKNLHKIMWLDFYNLDLSEYKEVYMKHFNKPYLEINKN